MDPQAQAALANPRKQEAASLRRVILKQPSAASVIVDRQDWRAPKQQQAAPLSRKSSDSMMPASAPAAFMVKNPLLKDMHPYIAHYTAFQYRAKYQK
jgi:hypothetical protein